ncbi:Glycosyl transferase family 2 [Geoglobus ahangari]|uniref:Glycosyl transferase family 2 n=1 Tax=Geoglobus ahangari TaxID=113653 RepID=A0A0F7IH43_9EURY|nr:dolichyl-phosphate beta-glucosyltransferase [Geoglobus ahangari]AKG91300.1 Glycosyl transferase family 2 [Geoglobus ahangari]
MISVILPAYNEAKRLERSVETLAKYLQDNFSEFEIIIAEDGSTDGTDEIARRLAEKYEFVTHLHSDERLGRGKALNRAIANARFEFVMYMDVDLSTDLNHVKEVYSALEEGYDVAIGSRLMPESLATRPFFRELPSRIYNLLVRILLGSKVRDHQCGFKGFRKSRIMRILERIEDNHWFWDTELLVLAQREGLRVKEIPVRWEHGGESKVSVLGDSVYMFRNILRMMK